jgi:pyruvate formate lyase activating enzyme
MQPEFLLELLGRLSPLHRAVETSGYGDRCAFMDMLKLVELVYYDIKLMDSAQHEKYTGRPNTVILGNADVLKASGVPFIVRIPLMQGVNDGGGNLRATAEFLRGSRNLQGVELLPYNKMAGAKYAMLDMKYLGQFSPPGEESLDRAKGIFAEAGINVFVR